MSNYPLLNLFLTMLWFFLWIMWFMLLFHVIADIFRDDHLGGWAKAGWTIFVCILPFLGIFVYLIARGHGMGERERERAQRQEQAFRSYVRDAAREPGPPNGGQDRVGELERLAGLRNHGDITEAEYQQAKSKLLAV
ncbi:SHOCT domain-containing protein [Amycolatopsis alkalitolerans]|uniref:SHOCT domain-containing protein n=1 Tax=Amycolatopsis alkalitolerans TaxID=2547244 RepID=A0A5C4M7A5_9PSEU|nr:SHOCT domain-containing protein [Amycolatopsis alkalitolerans]